MAKRIRVRLARLIYHAAWHVDPSGPLRPADPTALDYIDRCADCPRVSR